MTMVSNNNEYFLTGKSFSIGSQMILPISIEANMYYRSHNK